MLFHGIVWYLVCFMLCFVCIIWYIVLFEVSFDTLFVLSFVLSIAWYLKCFVLCYKYRLILVLFYVLFRSIIWYPNCFVFRYKYHFDTLYVYVLFKYRLILSYFYFSRVTLVLKIYVFKDRSSLALEQQTSTDSILNILGWTVTSWLRS